VGSLLLARNGLALIGLAVTLATVMMVMAQTLGKTMAERNGSVAPGDEQSGFLLGRFGPPVEPGASAGGLHGVSQTESVELVNMREQLDVSRYLARKYHLSSEAMELMVREAYRTGHELGMEPALLLAVVAVESGFNPFAESPMGAEGLMQVMAKVHSDKLEGNTAPLGVLDPAANIRVGALILKDAIRHGGSLRDGLRLYVGSTTDDDGGYGARVLQERDRIALAARGGNPLILPAVAAAPVQKPAVAIAPVSAPAAIQDTSARVASALTSS
jgi:hypothetical protein